MPTETQDLTNHPAAAILPLMSGLEFDALVISVTENGLLEPIVLHDGAVLDGRNRLRACKAANVEPQFIEWSGECESPIRYVIAKNLPRRHLTPSQKAAIATDLLPLLEAEARERQVATLKQNQKADTVVATLPQRSEGKAREQAAELADASPRYVQQAKAIRSRDEVLFERVRRGELSLPEAGRRQILAERIASLPGDEQEQASRFLDGVLARGNHSQTVIKLADNLLAMPQEDRTRVYVLSESDSAQDRSLALTEAAKLPPMPHPGWTDAYNAKQALARLRRHLDGPAADACRGLQRQLDELVQDHITPGGQHG